MKKEHLSKIFILVFYLFSTIPCSYVIRESNIVEAITSLAVLPSNIEENIYHEKNQHGTWLWNTQWIHDCADDIISFCQMNYVKLIYLQNKSQGNIEFYRSFIRKAHMAGIEVHALNGAPEWGKINHEREGEYFIQWVSEYNRQVEKEEQFTGIHLDVEPYLLTDWEQDKDSIIQSWTDNMKKWLIKGKQAELFMAADIPFWVYRLQMPDEDKKVSHWMLEQFDSLTIMAYRNQSNAIYKIAQELLIQADELGKSIFIGVDLNKTNEGNHVSFFGKSHTYFQEQLRGLKELCKNHPSFAGTAIHHLHTWYLADHTAPTAPTLTLSEIGGSKDHVTITLVHGSDSQSGVKHSEIKINDQRWQKYCTPLEIKNEGVTNIMARTIDNIGNISVESSIKVQIDRIVPSDGNLQTSKEDVIELDHSIEPTVEDTAEDKNKLRNSSTQDVLN